MKHLLFTFLILLIASLGRSQKDDSAIKNFDFQATERGDKILISFDLDGSKGGCFHIIVKVKVNGKTIYPKALTGDINRPIIFGEKKSIEWTWSKDVEELKSPEISLIANVLSECISARELKNEIPEYMPPLPIFSGMTYIAGPGAALFAKGLLTALPIYSDNQDIVNKLDLIKNDRSKYDEFNAIKVAYDFDSEKKKFNLNQGFALAGGAILVVSAYMVIKRAISNSKQRKKWERAYAYQDQDPTRQPLIVFRPVSNGIGVNINLNNISHSK